MVLQRKRFGVVPSHPYLLVDLQRLDTAGMSTDNMIAALAGFERASSGGNLGEAVRALGQWAVADAVIECDSAEALIARAKEVAGT